MISSLVFFCCLLILDLHAPIPLTFHVQVLKFFLNKKYISVVVVSQTLLGVKLVRRRTESCEDLLTLQNYILPKFMNSVLRLLNSYAIFVCEICDHSNTVARLQLVRCCICCWLLM